MTSRIALSSLIALAGFAVTGSSSALAGRAPGPGRSTTRCEAHDYDVYHMTFYGDDSARIVVEGDGDTDLDLYVYDENDNLIDSDTDGTDYCVVRFRPAWTGRFRIVVRNLGRVYNRYTISTN